MAASPVSFALMDSTPLSGTMDSSSSSSLLSPSAESTLSDCSLPLAAAGRRKSSRKTRPPTFLAEQRRRQEEELEEEDDNDTCSLSSGSMDDIDYTPAVLDDDDDDDDEDFDPNDTRRASRGRKRRRGGKTSKARGRRKSKASSSSNKRRGPVGEALGVCLRQTCPETGYCQIPLEIRVDRHAECEGRVCQSTLFGCYRPPPHHKSWTDPPFPLPTPHRLLRMAAPSLPDRPQQAPHEVRPAQGRLRHTLPHQAAAVCHGRYSLQVWQPGAAWRLYYYTHSSSNSNFTLHQALAQHNQAPPHATAADATLLHHNQQPQQL